MEGNMNEVVRLLSELSLSDDPKKQLLNLKTTLITLSSRMHSLPRNLELNALFDSFNSSDSEQVELAVDVLGQLLPFVSAIEVVERFSAELLRGLDHPHEKVRSLVLKQVLTCAGSESGVVTVITNHTLLLSVVRSIGDKSLGVVKTAISALTKICSQDVGLNATFSSESVTVMQEVMAMSDSCRFCIYEFMVQVCLLGNMSLGVVSNSGLLDRLTTEVTTGDVLTQLNALELITPLALDPNGMTLLDQGGVIAKLQYLLSLAETDPMAALLMPGLVKFFGNVGHSRPRQMIEEYSSVVVMVLRLASGSLDLGDPTLQMVAIQTVAHIGSSPEGKLSLAKCRTEMDQVLDVLGSKIRVAPTEQRVCVLEALTRLFSLEIEYQTEEITGLLELWWAGVAGVNLEKIVAVARQPFTDLHCAALGLISTLANMPWGQRLICHEPGLIEYILDRSTEHDKLGKESKWDVVETLVRSQSASSIFSENHMAQLEKYYREGPFYVEAQVEVALEGQN
ncbi:26S proteasome non-ATPase regulatory subunit 5 [Panulirus ornatus]|uniref:26S proteasome non-ATPase regulatory subunit 5 n=1 Tax=Panulirus ornatus TaxID=150431 RepID=UPI003A89C64A